MKESELVDIQNLIHRWEEGESLFSDPPLCADLLTEIRRLRGVLMDVFPLVVGTPMQEEVRAELGLPPVQLSPQLRGAVARARTRRSSQASH